MTSPIQYSSAIQYPKARAHLVYADGREEIFIINHVDIYPVYGTLMGRRRTLRDRLPENTPGEIRRLTTIEHLTKLIPEIASYARRRVIGAENDLPGWEPFTATNVQTTITSIGPERTHIQVGFRATAGRDVLTLTTHDPIR